MLQLQYSSIKSKFEIQTYCFLIEMFFIRFYIQNSGFTDYNFTRPLASVPLFLPSFSIGGLLLLKEGIRIISLLKKPNYTLHKLRHNACDQKQHFLLHHSNSNGSLRFDRNVTGAPSSRRSTTQRRFVTGSNQGGVGNSG